MKLGWPTTRTIFRVRGWITWRTGGSETLGATFFSSEQPGAASMSRSQGSIRGRVRRAGISGRGADRNALLLLLVSRAVRHAVQVPGGIPPSSQALFRGAHREPELATDKHR